LDHFTASSYITSDIACKARKYSNVEKIELRLRFELKSNSISKEGTYAITGLGNGIPLPSITQALSVCGTEDASDKIAGARINTDGEISIRTTGAISSGYVYINGFYYYG